MTCRKKDIRAWGWAVLVALCTGSHATAQVWSMLPPPAERTSHALAYDSGRGCTVLFGGSGSATMLGDTWELWGDQWVHVPTAASPPVRQLHAMAYDSARQRIVLFGGSNPSYVSDTWEYDGVTWTQMAPTASPPARAGHAMVYDASISAIVLFGGLGAAGYLSDTWLYDGTTWANVTPNPSPSVRVGCAMAYDPTISRTVLFGGSTFSRLGDTWEFDGGTQTWTRRSPAVRPQPRMYHAMAFDPTLGCVLFAGDGTGLLGDTWVYDPSVPTWTQLSPIESPPARSRHAMAFDPALGCVVFGGAAPTPSNDTWIFDGATWTQSDPVLTPPGRIGAGFVFEGLQEQLLLFGGQAGTTTLFTDTWRLDGSVWTEIPTSNAPPGQLWRAAAYDTRRACAVAFGGATANGGIWTMFDDTWEFDSATDSWTQRFPPTSPPRRAAMQMAYDARRGVVVLFGGLNFANGVWTNFSDTWEYDGRDWRQVPTENAPSPRMASLVYDARRGVVVLFGGSTMVNGLATPVGETWEYDGVDWSQIAPVPPNVEPSRGWANLTFDAARGRILLFDGIIGSRNRLRLGDQTWTYDGTSWTQLSVPVVPPGRLVAGMEYDPAHDRVVMAFGGNMGANGLPDVWEFHAAPVPTWSRYGFGCAGSNGVPRLDAAPGSVPALGGTFDLELTNLHPASVMPFLGVGLGLGNSSGLPLPLSLAFLGMPGCDLWIGIAPSLLAPMSKSGLNSAALMLSIPNDPNLVGLLLGMQAFCDDPGAAGGLVVSNAGIATVY